VRLIASTKCKDRPQIAREPPDQDGDVTFKVPAPPNASSVFYRMDSLVGGADPGDPDFETTSLFYGFGL
jgi:hypothetical protein